MVTPLFIDLTFINSPKMEQWTWTSDCRKLQEPYKFCFIRKTLEFSIYPGTPKVVDLSKRYTLKRLVNYLNFHQ